MLTRDVSPWWVVAAVLGIPALIIFFSLSRPRLFAGIYSGGSRATHVSNEEPTEAFTESPQEQKKDLQQQKQDELQTEALVYKEYLRGVDESITGERIAGNPYKFAGDDVDLHGTVVSVLDDSHFTMSTGDLLSGNYAELLVETGAGYATNLEAHQSIRVLGMVEQPTEEGADATIYAMFCTTHGRRAICN